MVGAGVSVTLGGIAGGKAPEPRRYLALGLVFVGTSAVAAVSPQLGAGFAGLVLAGTVLNAATGEKAAGAVARAVTNRGPITPSDAKPVAAPVAAASGSAGAAALPTPGAVIGVTPGNAAPASTSGSVVYPLAIRGSVIGRPGVGTHSYSQPPNNWQSDNAVDLGVPVGTPVFAPISGTVGQRIGSLNSSNPRMAGLRLTIDGQGQSWYLAHLSVLRVRAGQQVKAGQLIGLSGSANGVPHLHIAVNPPYDPVRLLGL
jgi:murein DD-endopeptidase MepM/ murein hydrolase activator NlpD